MNNSDTAVILHLFYLDLWSEIQHFLENLVHFDLFISIPDNTSNEAIDIIIKRYPNAFIYKLKNKGRDIGPFLELFKIAYDRDYKYICKIHTKKSISHEGGDDWRLDLLNKLLGNPYRVEDIKLAFDLIPDIGIIGAENQMFNCRDHLGNNIDWLTQLSIKSKVNLPIDFDFDFPAGSMFWFKPISFGSILNLNITLEDFEVEKGQIDGTLAHAMERIFPLFALHSGYKTIDTSYLEVIKKFTVNRLAPISEHKKSLDVIWLIQDNIKMYDKCNVGNAQIEELNLSLIRIQSNHAYIYISKALMLYKKIKNKLKRIKFI